MARLGLWLSGLHGLPEEHLGVTLPRLWARGRAEYLPAGSSLEVAGRIFGFAGPLPVAALLAEADGVRVDGRWVMALEPITLGGQAGRSVLQAIAAPEESVVDALFSAAVKESTEPHWVLARGRRRWYVLAEDTPDLQSPDPERLWGQSPPTSSMSGRDARQWHRFINDLQMGLALHPANQAREAAGEDPWCYFWAWGEGRLPAQRPLSPWQRVRSDSEYVQAVAHYLGIPCAADGDDNDLGPDLGPDPTDLLWHWSTDWLLPDNGARLTSLAPQLSTWLRHGHTVECYTGRLGGAAHLAHLRLGRTDLWRLWRRHAQPKDPSPLGRW